MPAKKRERKNTHLPNSPLRRFFASSSAFFSSASSALPRSALPACLAPVALPDGKVLYGAYTGYNGGRGHTPLFASDGSSQRSYDFGWDTTRPRWRLRVVRQRGRHRPVAIDGAGVVYANSEDGNLYAISPGGAEKQRYFLDSALGAAYTPLAIDARGRLYTQNAGHLYVVGGP